MVAVTDPAQRYRDLVGIPTNGKRVNLARLADELTAAGVPHNQLGMISTDQNGKVFTYDADNMPAELPAEAAAIVAAHAPDPDPDYGADADDTTPQQLVTRVQALRAYATAQAPANAATVAVVKILCWWALWQIRQTFRRPGAR